MLFKIDYIDHDIEKVHEIPHHFFTELQRGEITTFCEELFPIWMREGNFKGAIKTRFEELYNAIQVLTNQEKEDFCQAFFDSNQIKNICGNKNSSITSITDFPKGIQDIFVNKKGKKGLFVWLYDYILTAKDSPISKLIKTDIKAHYKKYQSKNSLICPFCGLEHISLLNSEGREGYDHYLHKTHYSFSSVNMKNLIPMGIRCNKKKGAENMLFDKNKRVEVFYPFAFNRKYGIDYNFILSCSKYPNSKNTQGEWKIELLENVDDAKLKLQIQRWKDVFNIHNRYSEYIQIQHFRWLDELFTDNDFINKAKINRIEVYNKLNIQFNISEPTERTLQNHVGLIPRFLYFKFLKDDEAFATELIDLFIAEKTRVVKINDDDLEL